jgi:hypothetical protein
LNLPDQTVGDLKRTTIGALRRRTVLAGLLKMSHALFGEGHELSQPLFIVEKSMNANMVHYDAVMTLDGGLEP